MMWLYYIVFAVVIFFVCVALAYPLLEKKMLEDESYTYGAKAIHVEGIEHFQNDQKVRLELLSDKMLIYQGENSVSLAYHKITDAHFDKRKELGNSTLSVKVVEEVDLYIKYNDESDIERQLVFKALGGVASTFEKLFLKRVFPESQNVPPPPSTLCGVINHHNQHILSCKFVTT